MLTAILFVAHLFAATPDTFLGYTIGQAVNGIKLPKGPQGAYMTRGTVAGQYGRIFLVPCGAAIHEIIFQVVVFSTKSDVDARTLDPSGRMASNPRAEARILRTSFEAALKQAGWVITDTVDLGPMGMSTVTRAGAERTVSVACEPAVPTQPEGPEDCTVSIHAGGGGWCTDGL